MNACLPYIISYIKSYIYEESGLNTNAKGVLQEQTRSIKIMCLSHLVICFQFLCSMPDT